MCLSTETFSNIFFQNACYSVFVVGYVFPCARILPDICTKVNYDVNYYFREFYFHKRKF